MEAGTPAPVGPVIAFDALGAEGGPEVVVEGVSRAAADGIGIRVFGHAAELGGLGSVEGVELIDSKELIGNDEDPAGAVRARPGASIVMAAADVAAGCADGLASPGATGATLAASVFAMKRLKGVQRPALAVQLPAPGLERPVLLLDAGANSEARATHLVQFAYLGAAFAASGLGIDRPKVALLSVGEEAKKGNEITVEAHAALAASATIDFVGNVEGRDLLTGAADVVVTDGFTGNVALKTLEGTARAFGEAVGRAARSGPRSAVGGLLLRPALSSLRQELDPDTTGGAIMLGLRAVSVVGHGSAGPDGIANQIRLAARAVRERSVERIAALLEESGAGRGALRDRSEPGS